MAWLATSHIGLWTGPGGLRREGWVPVLYQQGALQCSTPQTHKPTTVVAAVTAGAATQVSSIACGQLRCRIQVNRLVVHVTRTDSQGELTVYCAGERSHLHNSTECSLVPRASCWMCPAFQCICHKDVVECYSRDMRSEDGCRFSMYAVQV